MKKKIIIYQLGKLVILVGLAMLLPLIMAIYDQERTIKAFLLAIPITLTVGGIFIGLGRGRRGSLNVRDGFVLVSLAWVFASFLGTLPMFMSGYFPSFLDAFFETLSGFTATGISVLADIESLPRSLLLWRSMTQWLGGLGIVVLFVAMLSDVGSGSMQLFKAETTGSLKEKLRPRVRDTAKSLWIIYLLLTLTNAVALFICGMGLFDAVNHAMTTIATGGYSTRNENFAAFPQISIQWVTIIFMFLSGSSFPLYYRFKQKRDLNVFFKNGEWCLYVTITLLFSFIIGFNFIYIDGYPIEKAIRMAIFNVVSLISSTGFVVEDFDQWASLSQLVVLMLIFSGGCAGSTSGGVKIERLLILLLQTKNELRYILHPRMVTSLKINGSVVANRTIINVAVYVFLYTLIIIFATVVNTAVGLPILEAFTTSLSCVGNGGPSLGMFGPTESFAALPAFLKGFDCVLMLIGRLELYTILVVLLPLGMKHHETFHYVKGY